MNLNKKFAELLEKGEVYVAPDFAADPRLVLREMKRILDKDDFEDWLCEINRDDVYHQIDIGLILDTTGLLVATAIKWLEKEGKDG